MTELEKIYVFYSPIDSSSGTLKFYALKSIEDLIKHIENIRVTIYFSDGNSTDFYIRTEEEYSSDAILRSILGWGKDKRSILCGEEIIDLKTITSFKPKHLSGLNFVNLVTLLTELNKDKISNSIL